MRGTRTPEILGNRFVIAVVWFAALSFFWALLPATPSVAGDQAPQVTTITGNNDPDVDIQAVQKAVDVGGTVLLKGTFDFGDRGRVLLTRDVELRGDPGTTITGGHWTFTSPLPPDLPPTGPGPKIVIEGIRFDGALWAPIVLAYSGSATVRGISVTNVRPYPVKDDPAYMAGDSNFQLPEDLFIQCGIVFGPRLVYRPAYVPGLATGTLVISGNDIDLSSTVPEKTLSTAVFVNRTTGLLAVIEGNTILGVSRNSIEVLDNHRGDDGTGMIVIQNNTIITPDKGSLFPTPRAPNGIVAGWWLDKTGASDPARNPKHLILKNTVQTRGQTSTGIWVGADGAVIAENKLFMTGAGSAVILAGSYGFVGSNEVKGKGKVGLTALSYQGFRAQHNIFVDNDTSQSNAASSLVFSKGSVGNFACGKNGELMDLSTASK